MDAPKAAAAGAGTRKRAPTGPSGRGFSIKTTLIMVVEAFRACGVLSLRPETLRAAKFDEPKAVDALWRALHDTTLLAIHRRAALSPRALDAAWAARKDDPTARSFVAAKLAKWGYSPSSLPRPRGPPSSRRLLLALAWLVDVARLFERAARACVDAAVRGGGVAGRGVADTGALPSRGRRAESEARTRAQEQYARWLSSARGAQGFARVQHRANQIHVLNGRIRAALASVCARQEERLALANRLHKLLSGEPRLMRQQKPVLSQYDVQCIRDRAELEKRLKNMELWLTVSGRVLNLFEEREVSRLTRPARKGDPPETVSPIQVWWSWIEAVRGLGSQDDGDEDEKKQGATETQTASRAKLVGFADPPPARLELRDALDMYTTPIGSVSFSFRGDQVMSRIDKPETLDALRNATAVSYEQTKQVRAQARKLLAEVGKRRELNGTVVHT